MTESDSNSDCSYDSDDSEYNFIPGHVNIDDIEVEDESDLECRESAGFAHEAFLPDLYQSHFKILKCYLIKTLNSLFFSICKSIFVICRTTMFAKDLQRYMPVQHKPKATFSGKKCWREKQNHSHTFSINIFKRLPYFVLLLPH